MALFFGAVLAVFDELSGDYSLPLYAMFWWFLFYGIPAGCLAAFLGYCLRNVWPNSTFRWVWLSLLIPQCSFMLAMFQTELENMIECKTFEFKHDMGDVLTGIDFYAASAQASGLIAIALIGT